MSVEVMTLVWRADLPAMDKIVLLRLADFADVHGRNVYPSVERVQKECGVSERHARAVIKKFTTDGILVLVRQGGGRNRPAEYRFDLESLKRCIPCRVLEATGAENPAPGAPYSDEKGASHAGFQNQKGAPHDIKGAHGAENPAPGAPNPSESTSNRQNGGGGTREIAVDADNAKIDDDLAHRGTVPTATVQEAEEAKIGGTVPQPSQGRMPAIPDQKRLESEVIASHFCTERLRIWPGNPNFPAPISTLETQAKGFLDAGAALELVTAEITRVMEANHAKGDPNPPTNLRFCSRSLHSRIASAAGGHSHERNYPSRGRRSAYDPDESRRRTLAAHARAVGREQRDG